MKKITAAFTISGITVPELTWVPIPGKGVKGGAEEDFPEGWTISGANGYLPEKTWRAVLARLKSGPPLTVTG
jgi:hypothetical protein